jgi:hypothetical protein
MAQNHPTERISESPFGARDEAEAYVAEARREFRECLKKVFLDIASRVHGKTLTDVSDVTRPALHCRDRYFQTMKGATNITAKAVEELIAKECERQIRFYDKLSKLGERFRKIGVRFSVSPPKIGESDSTWRTGLTVGCNLLVGSTDVLAFPLVNATNSSAITRDILYVDDDCVIAREYPLPAVVEPFQHASGWSAEFSEPGIPPAKILKDEFPLAKTAIVFRHFLLVESDEHLSANDLEALLEKYVVSAVVQVDSAGNKAHIFIGKDGLPSLLEEELKIA